MKKCFLIIAILALATSVFAQHDEQVTIEGTYRPKVNKVNKLLLRPNAPTSTISFPDTEVQPMETNRKFDIDLDKINPLALSLKNTTDVAPAENFLMAGIGTRISPLFLYKHNSMLTKNTGIGVGVKHFSSWLNIKDYAPSGFMNNAFDVSVTTKEFDNLQLGGKVYYKNDVCHYYGVNVFVYSDQTYFVFRLKNGSSIGYEASDAQFNIENRKEKRNMASSAKSVWPQSNYGTLSCNPQSETMVGYTVPKFTLLKNEVLRVYIYEKVGNRNLVLTFSDKDINYAVSPI